MIKNEEAMFDEMLNKLVNQAIKAMGERSLIKPANRFLSGVYGKPTDGVKEDFSDLENDIFVLAGFNQRQGIKIKYMIKAAVCILLQMGSYTLIEVMPSELN